MIDPKAPDKVSITSGVLMKFEGLRDLVVKLKDFNKTSTSKVKLNFQFAFSFNSINSFNMPTVQGFGGLKIFDSEALCKIFVTKGTTISSLFSL